MKKLLPSFAVLALVLFGLTQGSPPAGAQPRIIQTHCDTVSFTPPLVRVTFAVVNFAGPIPVCSVHLTPLSSGTSSPDSCRIVECSTPPGWVCNLVPPGGAVWQVLPGSPCIPTNGKVENFDIVLDPLFCCYRVEFDDPGGAIFFTDTVCFECDKPVPNKNKTWGFLKLLYR